MHILAIVAGTNNPSNSDYLTDVFLQTLQEEGVTVEKIRLKDLSIPQFTLERYQPDFYHDADILKIRDGITKATGILIATPIWNFGVPAHLKNTIDCLGAFLLDKETRSKGQLNGKPFYFLFTGGAPAAAWKAIMKKTTSSLPQGLQYFGAHSSGTFFEGGCSLGSLVVDKRPKTLKRVQGEAKEFYTTFNAYDKMGKAPIKEQARSFFMRCGESILKQLFRK